MPKSPYENLPRRAFWRSGVVERADYSLADFYRPRFGIDKTMKIATAGSCFAQHVGWALRDSGFQVIDTEPPPKWVPLDACRKYGFGLYSARYGNIYTPRQLLQLWREAEGEFRPAMPVWEADGRFYDAQRPGVEPGGFDSAETVMAHRKPHLAAVQQAFRQADIFVFTFGLTETWQHTGTGTVYPTCPGTVAGEFDPKVFSFLNLSFAEVLNDFSRFRAALMQVNPEVKFLVTVSPVPLTATASGNHVEVATGYSKAVLRAVCGQLVSDFENVDYFPSYEIITSQKNAARFYNANLREVTWHGVSTVMKTFLAAQLQTEAAAPSPTEAAPAQPAENTVTDAEAVVCEEALLEAFRK